MLRLQFFQAGDGHPAVFHRHGARDGLIGRQPVIIEELPFQKAEFGLHLGGAQVGAVQASLAFLDRLAPGLLLFQAGGNRLQHRRAAVFRPRPARRVLRA